MRKRMWITFAIVTLLLGSVVEIPCLRAGETVAASAYQVLAPIRHGNLVIFPIVSSRSHETNEFLPLDEGLRSGEVVVTEAGNISPLMRPRHAHPTWQTNSGGAEVNRLVLVNNSKKPLLLLAGEIVTGGKQDRIIGKDRLVPAESDPIDVSVFCVEPGRWVGNSAKFGSAGVIGGIVQPSVRSKAMTGQNQQQVWDEVRTTQSAVASALPAPAREQVEVTSSYARVMQNADVQKKLESVTAPVEHDYRSLISQLRDKNAVGVVVAVNGEVIWADVFASTQLLEKYWPKLVRSYAAESVVQVANSGPVDVKSAQEFLDRLQGRREVVENEPGLYRHTEVTGEGFKVFELTSLLPKTGFDLHVAKMAE